MQAHKNFSKINQPKVIKFHRNPKIIQILIYSKLSLVLITYKWNPNLPKIVQLN